MNLHATLAYLKKKDASSIVVAILLALSLQNIVQVGAQIASQFASMLFATTDGVWTSLGDYFGRSLIQQATTSLLVALAMVAATELMLRTWLWYKAKK